MAAYIKDPEARLDYGLDWSEWLVEGETITASTWTLATANPDTVLTTSSQSHTDTVTVVWLAGGTLGADYEVTNHIVTSAGREDDRTHKIRVRNR